MTRLKAMLRFSSQKNISRYAKNNFFDEGDGARDEVHTLSAVDLSAVASEGGRPRQRLPLVAHEEQNRRLLLKIQIRLRRNRVVTKTKKPSAS